MNFLLSLVVALMMGASTAPTNPVIAEFIEKSQAEIGNTPGAGIAYEETFFGPAVVISQMVPGATKDMLSQLPVDEVKKELIKGMSADKEAKELIQAMKADKVNLIMRMTTQDGGNLDIIVTPGEFK